MCNFPHSVLLSCMYINALTTVDLWYSIKKQARYQPVMDCTYWSVLGSYNNFNINHLTPKSIPFEAFGEIHQVVLDCISGNMTSLAQSGKYGVVSTADTTTH